MADETPVRDDRAGMFKTIAQVLGRLSPEFLGLLIVDAVFMLSVVYLFHAQNDSRERVLGPALKACLESVPIDAVKLIAARPEDSGLKDSIYNMRQQITDARDGIRDQSKQFDGLRQAIDGLRPAIDGLRTDLTRDTRARLQGPAR